MGKQFTREELLARLNKNIKEKKTDPCGLYGKRAERKSRGNRRRGYHYIGTYGLCAPKGPAQHSKAYDISR